ncbi:1818_t:CDS:1, partial [Dentiscutata erythropus]
MNQSTNQIVSAQQQNINGQLRRLQNTANLFTGTLTATQQYNNLVGGADPFARTQRTQEVENIPLQSAQFSTLLISGYLFP